MLRTFAASCLTALLSLAPLSPASAQSAPPVPSVSQLSGPDLSPRLSSLPTSSWAGRLFEPEEVQAPKPLPPRGRDPGAGGPGDQALQTSAGSHSPIRPKISFGGLGANGYIPPDPNIAVGKTLIVQVVNTQIAVFDKATGGMLPGYPKPLAGLWGNNCGNSGDPIVQYDDLAPDGLNDGSTGRWLITQIGPSYSECFAISQTSDPTGGYYLYSQGFGSYLNDYPKFGVWPTATNSAYLASYNLFLYGAFFAGSALCAYDREAMLAGGTVSVLCSTISNDGNFLPSDLDGATPPANLTPGYFLNFETTSSLRLYTLSPDFMTGTSTLTQVTPDIGVASFAEACSGGTCIPQPSTSQQLDSLGDRLMYRLAYRVFPDHVAMVTNHSVTVGATVGVRWYELRTSNPAAFSLYQQGTFSPDSAYRWMGSAAMDGAGDIALGYSEASGSLSPEVVYTGRTPGMSLGTMGPETVMQPGNGSQTGYSRWGDYSALRIDPSDDTTFWYTNEYYTMTSAAGWSTVIGSFKVAASANPDFTAPSVTPLPLAVRRGTSITPTVSVTGINSSSFVTFSISGLKKGVTASFNPTTVTAVTTGSSNSTLKISASSRATIGTYTVMIIGKNGTYTHTTSVNLTVD